MYNKPNMATLISGFDITVNTEWHQNFSAPVRDSMSVASLCIIVDELQRW